MSRRDRKSRDDDRERKYELTHFSAPPNYSEFERNVLDKLNLVIEDLRVKQKIDAQALMRLVEHMLMQVNELLKVNDDNRENMIVMSLMSQFENNALFKGDASAWFYPYSKNLKSFYELLKTEIKIRSTQGSYTPILALDIFHVTRKSVEREHKEKMKNKDAKYASLEREHSRQLELVAKELKEKDRSMQAQKEDISKFKKVLKTQEKQLTETRKRVHELGLFAEKSQVSIKAQQEHIDRLLKSVANLNNVIREKDSRINELNQVIREKDSRISTLTDRLINVFSAPVLPSVRSSDLRPHYATESHSVLPNSFRSSDLRPRYYATESHSVLSDSVRSSDLRPRCSTDSHLPIENGGNVEKVNDLSHER